MNVLVATGLYPPEIGGPATHTRLMEEHLPAQGISISVLTFRDVRHLPKVIRHVAFAYRVYREGRSVDVLFAQDTMSVGLPMVLANFVLRKPLFIRVPGDHVWEQGKQRFGIEGMLDDFPRYSLRWHPLLQIMRRLQFFTVRRARIIVPSQYFKRMVLRWGVPSEKVVVVYNGVEELHVQKEVPRAKAAVSVGRLVPWKGFRELVALFADMPDWTLDIVGDGPEKEALLREIEKRHLGDRVRLLGSMPRNEMLRMVSSARVLVSNSTFESFSFQTVEAMRMGVPVVALSIGSLPELIENGKEGILVEPGDAAALKSAIERIEEESALREQIIAAAQNKARQFSIEKSVDGLVAELTRV